MDEIARDSRDCLSIGNVPVDVAKQSINKRTNVEGCNIGKLANVYRLLCDRWLGGNFQSTAICGVAKGREQGKTMERAEVGGDTN